MAEYRCDIPAALGLFLPAISISISLDIVNFCPYLKGSSGEKHVIFVIKAQKYSDELHFYFSLPLPLSERQSHGLGVTPVTYSLTN